MAQSQAKASVVRTRMKCARVSVRQSWPVRDTLCELTPTSTSKKLIHKCVSLLKITSMKYRHLNFWTLRRFCSHSQRYGVVDLGIDHQAYLSAPYTSKNHLFARTRSRVPFVSLRQQKCWTNINLRGYSVKAVLLESICINTYKPRRSMRSKS